MAILIAYSLLHNEYIYIICVYHVNCQFMAHTHHNIMHLCFYFWCHLISYVKLFTPQCKNFFSSCQYWFTAHAKLPRNALVLIISVHCFSKLHKKYIYAKKNMLNMCTIVTIWLHHTFWYIQVFLIPWKILTVKIYPVCTSQNTQ